MALGAAPPPGGGELAFSAIAIATVAALVIMSIYGILKTASAQRLTLTADPKGGAVALLIAHPDDETMFFVPTVLAARRDKHDVRVLCLSNGGYDGLGKVREKELLRACALLGISEDHVTIVDDERLQDGPKNVWEVSVIAQHLLPFIAKHNIGGIVTFDAHGVSGHPNHIALHTAVKALREKKDLDPAKVRAHCLQSVALLRKFMGPLAFIERRFFFVGVGGKTQAVFSLDLPLVYACLWAHKSQAVWYRNLFVLFARYTYMNSLQEM